VSKREGDDGASFNCPFGERVTTSRVCAYCGVPRSLHWAPKVSLKREALNRGGYTSAGRYFGTDQPLFRAVESDSYWTEHYRAPSREAAKVEVLKRWPLARFYR